MTLRMSVVVMGWLLVYIPCTPCALVRMVPLNLYRIAGS